MNSNFPSLDIAVFTFKNKNCCVWKILPPFHIIRLSNIAHIHIYVNESRHICVPRFINIYMNVGNAKKSYNLKRR